jgi:hypothetical protein
MQKMIPRNTAGAVIGCLVMASEVWMLGWRRVDDGHGHSMARVERLETGWLCYAAEVLIEPQETSACSFTIRLDQHWATREVEVTAVSRGGPKQLSLRADEMGEWWRDGSPAPDLAGCVDVDIAAAPLTNTFPISKLDGLGVSEQRTLPVAWVDVPTLQVQRVEQTYRRLGPDRWQYSDPAHGTFQLTVDDHRFVIDYEGLASRVTP